jgi:hypothetical protein
MWTLRRTLRKGAVAYMTFKDRFYDCRGFFTRLAAADDRRRFLVEEVESFDTLGVDELCLYKITSLQPIAA